MPYRHLFTPDLGGVLMSTLISPPRPVRVAIIGSRRFKGTAAAMQFVARCLQRTSPDEIEIISRGTAGADQVGERFADQQGYPVTHFTADWERDGRRAGYRCHERLTAYATHVIALWDGQDVGTRHLLREAHSRGLTVRVWHTRHQKHDRSYLC